VLERLRAAICQSPHPDLVSPVSVSVGAVTYMVAPDDLDMMVQMADSVMYSAKNEGKNRVYLDVIDAGSPPENVRLVALHT
jgi:GGDEF domain-containing protein